MSRLLARSLAAAALLQCAPALAVSLTPVATGFTQPVFLASPANDPRLFVVERAGVVKQVVNGTATPWLDIRPLVDTAGERGLLGLAFDPGFAANGRFYVNYIDSATKNTVVARYTVPNPASGLPSLASAATVLTVTQPSFTNHKAGWIGFRPGEPGNLYIATGDGGSGNDPNNVAQNLSSNLGKILRVAPGESGGYTIPAGNPFAGATPGNDEIWAYGLRNPYRNSFDRLTGDFWIADVGQAQREEVNLELAGTPGGRNYGWRALEGSVDNDAVADPVPPGATAPFFEYPHTNGNASIIGGYVYRGGADPTLEGAYVFGDFVSGRLWKLTRVNGQSLVEEITSPFGRSNLVSFGEDGLGGLYAIGIGGTVYQVAPGAVPEPSTYVLMLAGLAALGAAARRGCRPSRTRS